MSIVNTFEIGGKTLERIKQDHNTFKKEARKTVTAWEKEFKAGLETLLDSEGEVTLEQVTRLKELAEALDVAGDLGVDYYLPWDGEYDTTYSSRLEDFMDEHEDLQPEIMSQLQDVYDLLEDSLEYQCREWYNSNC